MPNKLYEELGKIRTTLRGLGTLEIDDAGYDVPLGGITEELVGGAITMNEARGGHLFNRTGNLRMNESMARGTGGRHELRVIRFARFAPPIFHPLPRPRKEVIVTRLKGRRPPSKERSGVVETLGMELTEKASKVAEYVGDSGSHDLRGGDLDLGKTEKQGIP